MPALTNHRHPVADTGITHTLMVQVERHQAIERPQHYAGDDAAIDPKARLTQAQHGPHPGCPLLLALLVDNAGKQQRQDGGQYQASDQGSTSIRPVGSVLTSSCPSTVPM